MDKNFFNKRCHYSIRKFAIGVASIMIGASIFGVNLVEAAETGNVGDKEGTITQAQPLEKLPDELAAVLKKAEENAGKEASSTVGNGETTGTIGSTDSTNNLKPAEAPRIPENETKPSEALVHELPEYTGPVATVGDQAAPTVEKPEFKGGVNAVMALVHELPEYTGPLATVGDQAAPMVEKPEFQGGVNSVMAFKHELPAYTGPLSTVGDQAAPTVEKPEFKLSSLEKTQTSGAPVQIAKEDKRLPETGEKQSETVIFLASVGLALSAIFVAKSKKEIN